MWLGWLLFAFGGLLCAVNFSLSLLRFPLFRLRGGRREDYRHISGFPLIGSGLFTIAWAIWIRSLHSSPLDTVAALLFILDTGGLHWFLAVMLCCWIREHR